METKKFEVGSYQIVRKGQQAPEVGDEVCVVAKITLPAGEDKGLDESIMFENRLEVCRFPLISCWGKFSPKSNSREMTTREFAATTWREAERQADEYAVAELEGLRAAVEIRREAMRKAN